MGFSARLLQMSLFQFIWTKSFFVQVNQIKSEFPLGSSVDADLIVNPDYTNYQDFFYDNFEWGQIENGMKWKQMESDQVRRFFVIVR